MTSPAAALAPVVDALIAEPLEERSLTGLRTAIAVVAPQAARLEGWLLAAQGQLHLLCGGELPTPDGGRRSLTGWLAEVRSQTPSACGRAVRTATALRTALPMVVEAVLDGVLTPEQAGVLSRLIGKIRDEDLADSQPHLITVAAGRDPAELAAWVRHLIATHCEPELDAAADRGRARRYLQTSREPDGALRGRFVLPGEDGEALLTVVEALSARQGLADERSAGQRRADALVDACEQVLRHGELPDHGGRRPQLSYVLPADWAAARQAEAACTACGPRCAQHRAPAFVDSVAASVPGSSGVPAEHACATAAWSGPQTRARIEALLCDARISRVLLDGSGQVRGLESLTDTVTATQRRLLAARDLGCTARRCTRPPALCDVHHLVHRAEGGATALHNLVLLCRRHHVLWHLGRLRLWHLHVPWHPGAGPPAAA